MGIGIYIGNSVGKSERLYWTQAKKASVAPTLLSVSIVTDTEATLAWTNNGTANYTGHKVYISTDNVTFTLKKTIATIGTSTIVTGLTRGTLYYFYVVAYKGNGESIPSNTANDTTLAWYDDFESNTNAYFALGAEAVMIQKYGTWNPKGTHTASVIDTGVAGIGGYRYWMWWCNPDFEGIGLARSNALNSGWTQYQDAPVIPGERSANVYIGEGVISLFTDVSPETNTYVVRRTTLDGLTLSDPVIYVPQEVGYFNTDSFFFKDPNTGLYHLYWNRYDAAKTIRQIKCKTAATIEGLITADSVTVIDQDDSNMKSQYFAGFSIIYAGGKYWLTFETSFDWIAGHTWAIFVLFSDSPTSGFQVSSDSPFLLDGRACPVQHLFNNQLYLYFSYLVASPVWDTRLIISDLTKHSSVQWIKALATGASIEYSAEQKVSGTKSLKIYSGNTQNIATTANKYFKASYNTIKVKIYITAITTTGSYNVQFDMSLAGTRVGSIGFFPSGSANWRYNNGTSWSNSTIPATIGWHSIIITFGAGGVVISVDSNEIALRAQVQWDQVSMIASRGTTTSQYTTVYFDDLRIEKV